VARNLETKARSGDLTELAGRATAAGARFEGRLEQTDTYFRVDGRRLKLREQLHRLADGSTTSSAELIEYDRPHATGARLSTYERTPVGNPGRCRTELAERHGVRGVVTKRRELWILGSTRIHLDRVEGLGEFVEIETVLVNGPEETYRAEHEAVLAILGIDAADTIACSYIDLAIA
jgi:adenylate cyclase